MAKHFNLLGYPCLNQQQLQTFMGDVPCQEDTVDGWELEAVQQELTNGFGLKLGAQEGEHYTNLLAPELLENNIADHFDEMAEELIALARPGMEEVLNAKTSNGLPTKLKSPSGKCMQNKCKPYWTRFEFNEETDTFDVSYPPHPMEKGFSYDTETFVNGSAFAMPVMATAMSHLAYYVWMHPCLLDPQLKAHGYDPEACTMDQVRGLMPSIGKNKFVVMHNCLPAYTDVLTNHGWLPLTSVRPGMKVLGTELGSEVETWTDVLAFVDGGMQEVISIQTSRDRLDCTSNHKVVAKPLQRQGTYKHMSVQNVFVEPKEQLAMHKAFQYAGNTAIDATIDECIYMGLWHTDGEMHGGAISSCKAYCPEIAEYQQLLLESLGALNHVSMYGSLQRCFVHKYWLDNLKERVGPRASLTQSVLNMSYEQTLAFCYGAWLGDGGKARQFKSYDKFKATYAKRLHIAKYRDVIAHRTEVSDALQIAFHKIGLKTKYDMHGVSGLKQNRLTNRCTTVHSLGNMQTYCLTTGTGNFVIRQHGEVMLTGNSAYDNTRVQERYEFSTTPINFVFCTMACHQATAGLNADQRWAIKKTGSKPYFTNFGSGKSLLASYDFFVANKYPGYKAITSEDKKVRQAFVDAPDLQYLHDMLPELLEYALQDAKCTYQLFQAQWESHQEILPSKVSLAAHFLLSSSLMPVDQNWFEWQKDVDNAVHELDKEQAELFYELAQTTWQDWLDGKDSENDVWLQHLDWGICGLVDTPISNALAKDLNGTDKQTLLALGLKPIPGWLAKCNGGKSLTTKKVDAHYLLKLSYKHSDGNHYPLVKRKGFGWSYEVGSTTYRVPHKSGGDSNVGSVLAPAYIPYFEKALLVSNA